MITSAKRLKTTFAAPMILALVGCESIPESNEAKLRYTDS
jgi:hypothetical protein